MIQCIILVLCVQSSPENLLDQPPVIQRQSYTKQIVVNSIFSIGLGLGAGYFHKRGNDVYDEYLNSTSIAVALDKWDEMRRYDVYRNVLAVGSAFFLVRALYYSMKNISSDDTGLAPSIDINYARRTVKFGITATL